MYFSLPRYQFREEEQLKNQWVHPLQCSHSLQAEAKHETNYKMQVDCFIFNVFSYDMKNYFTIFVEFLKDFNEFFRCKLGVALELQHTECFFAFHSVCLQDHNNSYIAQNSLLILCTSPTHARFGAARRLAKNSNWSLHALNRCNMENKQGTWQKKPIWYY